jgi:hypothetical protein
MKGNIKRAIRFLLLMIIGLGMLVSISFAITNGQPDGNAHPYVGLVTNFFSGGIMMCSCAAISSTVVVTSAHCFDVSETVLVSFDSEIDPLNPSLVNWNWGTFHPHPDHCIGCEPGLPRFDTHDLAVIVLFSPVTLPKYAQLPVEGFVDTLPNRTYVEQVGYGVTHWYRGGGPPVPGLPSGIFTRYFAPARLIPSNHKHREEYIKLSGNPAQGKGATCYGDSGGPNLLYGTDTILALSSYGTNAMCAGVGYSNRIDTAYAFEFINDFLDGS